jgi:phage shock protein PspC (stress-responsive transcriptional regulator)
MSQIRIARDGSVLGDYTLEQVVEGAQSGTFRPSDDALITGSLEWSKLIAVAGVTFPASAFPAPPAPVAPAPPLPTQYSGIYRSSDEKVLLGLCGGISHRVGVAPGLARFVLVLTWFFTWSATFWIYWFALLLPALPTQHLRRD